MVNNTFYPCGTHRKSLNCRSFRFHHRMCQRKVEVAVAQGDRIYSEGVQFAALEIFGPNFNLPLWHRIRRERPSACVINSQDMLSRASLDADRGDDLQAFSNR